MGGLPEHLRHRDRVDEAITAHGAQFPNRPAVAGHHKRVPSSSARMMRPLPLRNSRWLICSATAPT